MVQQKNYKGNNGKKLEAGRKGEERKRESEKGSLSLSRAEQNRTEKIRLISNINYIVSRDVARRCNANADYACITYARVRHTLITHFTHYLFTISFPGPWVALLCRKANVAPAEEFCKGVLVV